MKQPAAPLRFVHPLPRQASACALPHAAASSMSTCRVYPSVFHTGAAVATHKLATMSEHGDDAPSPPPPSAVPIVTDNEVVAAEVSVVPSGAPVVSGVASSGSAPSDPCEEPPSSTGLHATAVSAGDQFMSAATTSRPPTDAVRSPLSDMQSHRSLTEAAPASAALSAASGAMVPSSDDALQSPLLQSPAAGSAPPEADELAGVDWRFNTMHFRGLHEAAMQKLRAAEERLLKNTSTPKAEQATSNALRERVRDLEAHAAEQLAAAPQTEPASAEYEQLKKQARSQSVAIKRLEKSVKKKDAENKALRDVSRSHLGASMTSMDDSLPPGTMRLESVMVQGDAQRALRDKDAVIAKLEEKLGASQDAVLASMERGNELAAKLQATRGSLEALQKCIAVQASQPAGRSVSPPRLPAASPPGAVFAIPVYSPHGAPCTGIHEASPHPVPLL